MRKSLVGTIVVIVVVVAVAIAISVTRNNNPNQTGTQASTTNSSNNQSNTGTDQSATATVNIRDMMFTPSQVTVAKGGTVTWTNNDNVAHTVVIDHGTGPHSGDIKPGNSFSYTFNQSGSYQYHCSIHPSMRGTIVVK